MKVLFATSKHPDYISGQLWDGLRSLLGNENVVDATGCDFLHRQDDSGPIERTASPGEILGDHRDFDLLVLNACFNRNHDWNWVQEIKAARLKPGARIAYVEGWDGANEIYPVPMHVDHVFRREYDPVIAYPYAPITPLTMSAPLRWFDEPRKKMADRFIDVICLSWWHAAPIRWECYQRVFDIAQRNKVVLAGGYLPYPMYWDRLKNSKLCICPPGGGNCSDTMRTYEAVACGTIPVFVGHPKRINDPWFASYDAFFCPHPNDIPPTLNRILSTNEFDLQAMSDRLVQYGRTHHTTIARAATLLKYTMGVDRWELSESLKKRIANVCS